MTRPKEDLELDGLRFRALSNSESDILSEVDRHGRVTYVSPNHARLHGPEPKDLRRRLGLESVLPEDRPRVMAELARLFAAGENVRTTFRSRDELGRLHWIECTGTPVTRPEGEVRALLISRDVTEQKEIELHLEASRERFQTIAENAYDMIAEYDEQGHALFLNGESLRNLGLEENEDWKRDPLSIVHPEDRPRVERAVRGLASGSASPTLRYRVAHADGSYRTIEARYRRFTNSQGEGRIHAIARDMTEQVESERRIAESEARYRELVESSPLGIVVVQDGAIVFANRIGAGTCGAEQPAQLLGVRIVEILHPEDAVAIPKLIERVEQGERIPDLVEARLLGLDGQLREVIATGSIIDYEGTPAYQGVLRDVTGLRAAERERKRLELQLQEASKLESLGMLAGGIAHDFNNLLAVILSNTRFARRQVTSQEGVEALSDAIEAADQAARLTQQLLVYAGRRAPDVRSTDLSLVARATTGLFASALPRGVELTTDFAASLPRVRADVVQLEQVLMNLVINAGDAMAGSPGRVHVATGRAHVSEEQIAAWVIGSDLGSPGEYVFLEVRDTGVGMDAETRKHIFDPFFTTRKTGHGLGLAAVLGMVRGHQGGVELDTGPGRGTCFRIYLPAEPAPRSDAGAVVVFGVEDATGTLSRSLRRRGLFALQAGDANAAHDLLRQHGDEIEAAICGEGAGAGPETIARGLRALRPALPILWIGSREIPAAPADDGPWEALADADADAAGLDARLEALLGKD